MCGWDVFKILAVPGDTYFPPALRGIRDVNHDGVAGLTYLLFTSKISYCGPESVVVRLSLLASFFDMIGS